MADQASNGAKKRARPMIAVRPRVGAAGAVVLALAFALLATPLVNLDSWLQASESFAVVEGKASPVTVRIPQFSGFGAEGSADRVRGGQVVIARGDMIDANQAALVRRIRAQRPSGPLSFLAFFAGLFLLGLLYTSHMRRSHMGRLVRTQVVTLGLLIGVAAAIEAALIFTPMSVLVVPVAAVAIIATLAVDVSVGLATGMAVAMLMAFLVPFDAGTVAVLAVQAFAGVLAISGRKLKPSRFIAAGLAGGLAAATAYAVFFYLANHATPVPELSDPMRSAWVASAAGGLISGVVALLAYPFFQWLLGEITKNRLVELEDLSNPLLKQIADNSPGTWQHSLAMANMAETAANAIGASGRLVRVGAYYHDLGKSLQPSYFIENLRAGEQSPHDRLAPEVSCDAIFAHVTEGVALGRKEGLPERIVDFMHMHHGDGRLEYFWSKCQEQGNPKALTEEHFRYPGVRPQTRETAILAIVDAVEAASRTLKNPDEYAIRNLVQKLVYGKLHLGQLDESGLTVADLRLISNALVETIKHAFHGRIEYPWQRKEREATADEQLTQSERPRAPSELAVAASRELRSSATQRIIDEPRLDSLDVPRPYWRSSPRGRSVSSSEVAATAQSVDAYASTAQSDNQLQRQVEDRQDADSAPALTGEQLAPTGEQPALTGERPALTGERPALAGERPALTGERPAPTTVAESVAAVAAPVPVPVPVPAPAPVPVPAPIPAPPASATAAPISSPSSGTDGGDESSSSSSSKLTLTGAPLPEAVRSVVSARAESADGRTPTDLRAGETQADQTETVLLLNQKKVQQEDDLESRPTLERPVAQAPEAASEPLPARSEQSPPEPERQPPSASAASDRAQDDGLAMWNDALLSARAASARSAQDMAEGAEQATAAEGAEAALTEPTEPAPASPRKQPPPPPGSRARHGRSTIPLMKGDEAAGLEQAESPEGRAITRADTENESLTPGMMILGPPPATHKSKK